jgi:hypothetical protein
LASDGAPDAPERAGTSTPAAPSSENDRFGSPDDSGNAKKPSPASVRPILVKNWQFPTSTSQETRFQRSGSPKTRQNGRRTRIRSPTNAKTALDRKKSENCLLEPPKTRQEAENAMPAVNELPEQSISSLSTPYITVSVKATGNTGQPLNPTGANVQFAFKAENVDPGPGDWNPGSWDTYLPSGSAYIAKILIGPNSSVNPGVGTWVVWVKITDNPEVPVCEALLLTIT